MYETLDKIELATILALEKVKGLGPVKFRKIYEELGSISRILDLSDDEIARNLKFPDKYVFKIDLSLVDDFERETLSERLYQAFKEGRCTLSEKTKILKSEPDKWKVVDMDHEYMARISKDKISVFKSITYGIVAQKKMIQKYLIEASTLIEKAQNLGAHILSFSHPIYPKALYSSNQPVPVLYVVGDLDLFREKLSCAVVGTRKPDEWTVNETKEAVKKLCDDGYLIVSGLALGIDAVAHNAALECGGKTVAVLGCGVDVDYPRQNSELKRIIQSKGAIVSEYPFGTKVQQFRLKKRNKIIIGLSGQVLIAQTSEKGGTMNSYIAAIEQKKKVGVFVPPISQADGFRGNIKIMEDRKTHVLKFMNGREVDFEARID